MKLFGLFELRRIGEKQAPFENALMRLVAAQEGYWGGGYGAGLFGTGFGALVNPENCMSSPTVQAIVTAVSRRIAVSPPQVFKRIGIGGDTGEPGPSNPRERRVRQPNHPVEKLLNMPNEWQARVNYWEDATSRLLRYGNFYAYKSRGSTGPIRALIPIQPRQIQVEQDLNTWAVTYRLNGTETSPSKIHHVRGPSRNGIIGDSPVMDVNASIALEIAAEQFGASFFNNGAMPLMIFKYMQGMQGFKTAEDEKQFITDFQNALGGNKRHRALLLPKGIDTGDPVKIENDKAQFLETRKHQRTVIAGAFGVPPHLVGDLERSTFNNVEQQSTDFTVNVVLPIAQQFESAMERDLLTDADRAGGIIIRLDLDAVQLVDFKGRQEGFKIMRESGVISPNDWRARENMNPISDTDGGEDYIRPLNYVVAGKEPPALPAAKPGDGADTGAGGNGKDQPKLLHELIEAFEPRFRTAAAELVELVEKMQGEKQEPILVQVAAPIVNIAPAEVKVTMPPIHIEAPITVERSDVHVAPPEVNVQPAQIHAPITVEGHKVNVEPPVVHVDAADKPTDRIIERGKDGRIVAIRRQLAKR